MATRVLEDQEINISLTPNQLRKTSEEKPFYLKVTSPNSSEVMDAYLNTATLQLMYDPPYVDPSIPSSNLSALFRIENVQGEDEAFVLRSFNVIPSATLKVSDQPTEPDIYDITLKVNNSPSHLFSMCDSDTHGHAIYALPEGKDGKKVFLRPFKDEKNNKIIRGETGADEIIYNFNIEPADLTEVVLKEASAEYHCNCCQCAIL